MPFPKDIRTLHFNSKPIRFTFDHMVCLDDLYEVSGTKLPRFEPVQWLKLEKVKELKRSLSVSYPKKKFAKSDYNKKNKQGQIIRWACFQVALIYVRDLDNTYLYE